RDRRADTDSFRVRSSDPGWARGRPAVRRQAPWSAILFFPLEAIARAADQRLLGGILDGRLGIGEREPAHGIHLIVAVRETAAAMAHQEEAHPLEDAHGRAVVVAARVPVGHVAEGVLDLADEPGLLADLTQRGSGHALARLHVSLGDAPHHLTLLSAPPAAETHLPPPVRPPIDEASARQLANR